MQFIDNARAILIVTILLCSLAQPASCYDIIAGSPLKVTTSRYLEIGAGNAYASSNAFTWLRYLRPSGMRMFVMPVTDYTQFIGSSFGKSFSGFSVTDEAKYRKAEEELRAVSNGTNKPDFLAWIKNHPSAAWDSYVFAKLDRSNSAKGSPGQIMKRLNWLGIKGTMVWHFPCWALAFESSDRKAARYWQERWEMYRVMYVGATWMASLNVLNIEQWNEPQNRNECLTQDMFRDHFVIRSKAIRNAYKDFSQHSGRTIRAKILAPTSIHTYYDEYTATAVKNRHVLWPTMKEYSFWDNMDSYSFHQYVAPGKELRSRALTTQSQIKKLAGGDIPMALTEVSCLTSAAADKDYKGIEVVDDMKFATCVAGQVAHLQGVLDDIMVYKFSQTSDSGMLAKTIKTGLMFADNTKAPYDIGGSSKTGEAYRLQIRKTAGDKLMWDLQGSSSFEDQSSKIYMTSDSLGYYLYSVNARTTSAAIKLDVSKLPEVDSSAPYIVHAVSSRYHNEVTNRNSLSSDKLSITQPGSSLIMVKIAKGTTQKGIMYPVMNGYVAAGQSSNSNVYAADRSHLVVGTNPSGDNDKTYASILEFDTSVVNDASTMANRANFMMAMSAMTSRAMPANWQTKLVAATLSLHINWSNNKSPQIITVLGFKQGFNEGSLNWNAMGGVLKQLPDGKVVNSISNNFINWVGNNDLSAQPQVVGHITIQPNSAGRTVSLDVTDYIGMGGKQLMLLRMWRKDARGSGETLLKGDSLDGIYKFDSRAASPEFKPRIDVVYQT